MASLYDDGISLGGEVLYRDPVYVIKLSWNQRMLLTESNHNNFMDREPD